MIRKILDTFTDMISYFKKNKKIKSYNKSIKLNLACGCNIAPGWINLDGGITPLFSKLPKFLLKKIYGLGNYFFKMSKSEQEWSSIFKENKFIQHNLKYGIPFNSNSINYIFCSHFLEHLTKNEAKRFLKECYRVLKPKGTIRLSVPNLKYILNLYKKGKKTKALSYFYLENPEKFSKFDQHKWMYDFELLEEILNKEGFRKIKEKKFQIGDLPDLNILDNRKEESLFIESKK